MTGLARISARAEHLEGIARNHAVGFDARGSVIELADAVQRLVAVAAQQDDLLRRLSEWDVLNLTPGSGDDGPYWQGEIAGVRAALAGLDEGEQA